MVPLILVSDTTHLSKLTGDCKAWLVYMTIGNIHSSIRMAQSKHAIALIALLPIPMRLRDLTQARKLAQKKRNKVCYPELSTALEATSLMVIKEILQRVFHKLFSPMRNIELFNEEFLTRCADGGM